ncbi:P-loop containing nucleoside triphosphate hydrolase protein [Tilletiaria anomala UBC 951]|uniref:p-loop containing nucleoside triphosphate hydrolase protein n=1 Tax=Tilletiaria anomala (strain ATCC 24038 / CBS 436.72 / UBC 951) TaxID=1037660 RepID=A0A066W3C0_TILAU|nr:P-loop containing nucleoside triphosphate hydrolase protein [Tilletiaria anomala UBC 951]KDN45270.1 P-loop containing nucleoside triphosphate hydrolase protein [Tilletiaria anomala UBC 951]
MAQLARTKTKKGPALALAGLERPGASSAASASAADAAAAAEFASKKYVWVPDKLDGYVSGWVVREEESGNVSVVSLSADGSMKNVATDDLSKMNPPKFEKAEDIADLTFLNEASVVHNLRQRYHSGLIYTYSGLFLVAINPYHSLPIYTDAIVAAYKGRRREENAPHVFALADGAMRNMLEHRENQSLLITGESGAGKTENTKKVIQYLAAVAADTASGAPSEAGNARDTNPGAGLSRSGSSKYVMDQLRGVEPIGMKRLGLLERQILQANPILEAFGNAQTIRNNNSSRFGKFVRIEFTSMGAIAGANIDWYLLEKSRVTNRSEKERSFHIFYQLLRSNEREIKSKLLLTSSPEDYGYLKHTRKHVEGIDDRIEFTALRDALQTVGFTPDEQFNLFRVVASILQIGNLELDDSRSGQEHARFTNASPQIEKVCHVLGVPEAEFTNALVRPRVKAGREWVTQARTRRQVIDEMAALCKTMYEKTFAYIVDRINKALDRPTSKSTFIGVLDIAGFEIFEINSFEQLCINYTNEKLQQFFNHHMFVLEQEEYARENIEWDFVNFGLDLQPTIDLIESTTPIGILSCLDEECIMPKATDITFTEKLTRIWGTAKDGSAVDSVGAAIAAERGVAHGSTKFAPARFAQGFTVKHYAGAVEYRTDGWLDKNKDPLNDNLTRVMSESTDRFIATLFAEYAVEDDLPISAASAGPAQGAGPKRRIKRGAFRTLASLMTQLGSTQPHFVRCIPGKIEVPLVLEQLRCNGVLEGIRIARLGYPNRLLFSEFRNRYEVLTPGIIPRGYMDGRKACQRMVEALELDRATFKIGTSKIFFKAGRRDRLLYDIFSRFEAACRMFTARRQMKKILNRAAAIRTIQRNARVYAQLREWPWWQLYTKLKRKEMELALEKQKLEALKHSLEAEKKKLLQRSKERESALEEDLAAMQADLERAMSAQQLAEQSHKELKTAFDAAAEHLLRLESDQKVWAERELELSGHRLQAEHAAMQKLAEREEDVERAQARMASASAARESERTQTRQSSHQLAELARASSAHEEELRAQLNTLQQERDLHIKTAADHKSKLDTALFDLSAARSEHQQTAKLDETRKLMTAKSSEDETQKQLQRMQAEELATLRQQFSQHSSTEETNKLKAEHAAVSRDHVDASTKLQGHEKKLMDMTEGDMRGIQDKHEAAQAALSERQLAAATSKHQGMEDALLELERAQAEWKTKHEHISTELSAETKRRELLQSAIGTFDNELAQLKELLGNTQAELKKAQSMTNKTIVEHVHYTDRQLAETQSKLQELAHYTKTLEKSKARLLQLQKGGSSMAMRNAEPASKKLEAEVSKLSAQLKDARRERDEALSNARRKDLQVDESLSRTRQQYEARINELEKELKGSQAARGHTFMNLEELVKRSAQTGGDDSSFRRRLLEELRMGHDELEQDIAAKADLLRNHKMNGSTPKKEKPIYAFGNVTPSGGNVKRASLQFVEDTRSSTGGWQKEKSMLEGKVQDLMQAYQESLQGQRDGQAQSATLLSQIRDLRSTLDESELKYSQLQAAYNSLVQEAGVDEEMIASLQRAVERYKSQADEHMASWRKNTRDLEQQTAQLRSQATLRRPGSSTPAESAIGSTSPSRMSRQY